MKRRVLTIGVLQRLLLLRGLRDDFDASTVEDADVLSVSVEHLHLQHEVLSLVRVRDVQRLRRSVHLRTTASSICIAQSD